MQDSKRKGCQSCAARRDAMLKAYERTLAHIKKAIDAKRKDKPNE